MKRLCHALLAGLLLTLAPPPARADALDDWSAVYLRALQAENNAPPLGARSMAIYSVAVADAVNALGHRWQPYLFTATNSAAGADLEATVAAAAYRAGVALYPSRRADFDVLWAATQTNLPATPAREAGFRIGFASADTIIEARAADGSNTQVPYIPSDQPGAWRRTPPWFRPPELPHWGRVRPFALTNGAQFRPPGPPALASARYAEDYALTSSLGAKDSTARTADQTVAARFWSDFTGTVTPPGHWTQITLALARSNQLALADKAHLLALVHVALADAGIACWDAKYTHNFWRPVTAIQRGEADGNPATMPDPQWESLLPAPPFQDYVSGHSTFSGAAAQVLRRWFGRDDLPFTIASDTVPGVTRSYPSLSAAVEEIGRSRVWGGIHFRAADEDGQIIGRLVGDWAFDHALRPVAAPWSEGWGWKLLRLAALLGLGYGALRSWRRRGEAGEAGPQPRE